jgi:hypothetical protein
MQIHYVSRIDELLPFLLAPPEEGDASSGSQFPKPEARA